MRGIARELAASGEDVTVLAPVDARPGDSAAGVGLAPPGCDLVDLGRSIRLRANGSVAPVALGPRASRRAVLAMRHRNFEILHIHEPLAPGANYACLALGRMPKIGTFHRSGNSAFYTLLRPLARGLVNRLSVRCAVSSEARDTVAAALGGPYELIGNGVDFERFASADPWPKDGPTVMFVGRHETRKGLGILLSAFSSLGPFPTASTSGGRAVLWIAGAGPETQHLKSQYPESRFVRWLGRIPDEEVAMRLRSCDVACFPALGGESFGVVLLEAMSAGAAVVASDIPGYRSAASSFARFVPPNDPASLAVALRDAFCDALSGRGLSSPEAVTAAMAYAEASSMAAVAARYARLYEQVVRG